MPSPPVGVERRVGQRFGYHLPVTLRESSTGVEGLGFTQDVSSRGVFLFTEMLLREGAEVELTLKMPSEITLGESMRVRCQGRVLRVVEAADIKIPPSNGACAPKIGVAVCLRGYQYLPESDDSSADFRRISALHSRVEEEKAGAAELNRPPSAAH
jgi:hypothetical protein